MLCHAGPLNPLLTRACVDRPEIECSIFSGQVKGELSNVSSADTASQSLARLDYHPECEAAVNEQINIEYNISKASIFV